MTNEEKFKLITDASYEKFKNALETGVLRPNDFVWAHVTDLGNFSDVELPIIILAAQYNQIWKVKLLIDGYNVSVNTNNNYYDLTPLLISLHYGHQHLFNILIEKNADVVNCFRWCLDKWKELIYKYSAKKALINLFDYLKSCEQNKRTTIFARLFTNGIIQSQDHINILNEVTFNFAALNEDQFISFLHTLESPGQRPLDAPLIDHFINKRNYIRQIKQVETSRKVRQYLQAEDTLTEVIKDYPKGAWGYYYLGLMFKNGEGKKPQNYLRAIESLMTAVKNAEDVKDNDIIQLATAELDKIAELEEVVNQDEAVKLLLQFNTSRNRFQKGLDILHKRRNITSDLAVLKCACHLGLKEYSAAIAILPQLDNDAAMLDVAEQVNSQIHTLRSDSRSSDAILLAEGLVNQLDYGPAYFHLAALTLLGEKSSSSRLDGAIELYGRALNARVNPQYDCYTSLKRFESDKDYSDSLRRKAAKLICDFCYAVCTRNPSALTLMSLRQATQILHSLAQYRPEAAEVIIIVDYQKPEPKGFASVFQSAESKLSKLKNAATKYPESFGIALVLFEALKSTPKQLAREIAKAANKLIHFPNREALPQTLYGINVVESLKQAAKLASDDLLRKPAKAKTSLDEMHSSSSAASTSDTSLYPAVSSTSSSSATSSTSATSSSAAISTTLSSDIQPPADDLPIALFLPNVPSAPPLDETSSSTSTADSSQKLIGTLIGIGSSSKLFAPVPSAPTSASSASTTAISSSSKRTLPAQENLSDEQLKTLKQKFPGVQIGAAMDAGKRRMSL